MLRKLGFAIISVVVLPVGVDVQALSGLGVVVVSLTLQIHCSPYTDPAINRMEVLALATSFATLFFGLYLFSPNTSPWFRMISSLAVVGMNAGFLLYVAYTLHSVVKEVARRHSSDLSSASTEARSRLSGRLKSKWGSKHLTWWISPKHKRSATTDPANDEETRNTGTSAGEIEIEMMGRRGSTPSTPAKLTTNAVAVL